MKLSLWIVRKIDYWMWYDEYRRRGLDKESAKIKAEWRVG